MMRQQELISGIDCHDENGKVIGQSRIAAVKGISQVSSLFYLIHGL